LHIRSATLAGYRNLTDADLDFSPRVNLVLGRNGEGKTNLLEALNYFALGRSHRGSRNEDLIAFDGDDLHVRLEVCRNCEIPFTFEYGLNRRGESRLRIDGEAVVRRTDLVGRLATVFFNPETTQLVRGGPRYRRQYLDLGRSEIDPVYLQDLSAFQRALRQKGTLLRDLRRGVLEPGETRRELVAWNRELARASATVCLGRVRETALLNGFVQANHNALLDNDLELILVYRPRLECLQGVTEEKAGNPDFPGQLEREIAQELDYIVEQEIRRGRPLAGPQFDDLEIGLDGVDLRQFGSQGETRTAAIAMTLARSDVLFATQKVRPVIFFDDIFSELDRERARRLQEMAASLHQVFIATARPEDVEGWEPRDMRRWRMESGRAVPATVDGMT